MMHVYIDGACKGNPGPGGWAIIIVSEGGQQKELSGCELVTTNNRMELRAAIEALGNVPSEVPLTIVADSQYVIKGMTEWVTGWKRRGWRKADGGALENRDLWQELDRLSQGRSINWNWTRGHAGQPENERANQLAQAQAQGQALPERGEAKGHIQSHPRHRYLIIPRQATFRVTSALSAARRCGIETGNRAKTALTGYLGR